MGPVNLGHKQVTHSSVVALDCPFPSRQRFLQKLGTTTTTFTPQETNISFTPASTQLNCRPLSE